MSCPSVGQSKNQLTFILDKKKGPSTRPSVPYPLRPSSLRVHFSCILEKGRVKREREGFRKNKKWRKVRKARGTLRKKNDF